jgi:hypothetical protein
MTARAVTIVDALKTVFTADTTLAGWFITGGISRIYTFRDYYSVQDSNPIYPYMILDVMDVRSGDADNIRQQDILRQTFPLMMFFACSSLDDELVKRGALTATPAVPGIFDIYDKIISVLYAEPSIGDTVRYAAGQAGFSCGIGRAQTGENWIGSGLIIKEVYQDISKY